jgi:formyltetrahydrofolate deformylase
MNNYRVLIDSTDEKGLVYKVSKIFFDHDLNIISNNEHVDHEHSKFYMRTEVSGSLTKETLLQELKTVLPEDAHVQVTSFEKKNIVIMATKELHCLGDILVRHEAGELDANILAVIGNYDAPRSFVEKFNIPFITVSHEGLNRTEHANKVLEVLKDFDLDYLVLAKYMRILPPHFVKAYANKIINIHHSFLPAFIGANPYKQAFERGVKIIGATAHIVTDNLDEGPIISQDIVHVDHTYDWKMMQQAGRNVEKVVLSNALQLMLADRVLVYANKTIVF